VSHPDPAILALLALGEPAGTSHDDHHLAQCGNCQSELERLTEVVELARQDGPLALEQPPPGVWEQIAAAVAEDMPTAAPLTAESGRAGRDRRRLTVALAGLAAGLIIGIGGTVAVAQLTSAPATRVVAEIDLRPVAQFPQWQGATGTATLQDDGPGQLLAVSVTAPRLSGFYEVWLLGRDGTSMISLGDLNAAQAGTFELPAGVDLDFYSRIDVSLQPFNGSTLHSRTSVVRGSLPTTAGSA
jgi:hypothetical protein